MCMIGGLFSFLITLQGIQPTRGILLANGYSDSLQEMVRILNTLPTPNFPDGQPSVPYTFSLATHKDKQLL